MGRPERPLNIEDSPLVQFAADLRRARDEAGRPTYRAMSRLVHRSQTTLSEAAGGRTVPTWETVQAFLLSCGVGETAEWRRRWESLTDISSSVSQARAVDDIGESSWRRRQKLLVVVIGTVFFLAVSIPLAIVVVSGDRHAASSTASTQGTSGPPAAGIADGADPEESGCANDSAVTTVDAKEVDIDEAPVGIVELRYSPRCGVSWPRYTPADPRYSTIDRPGPMEAHVTVIPDSNQAGAVTFSTKYVGLPVFGNVINSLATCVRAEAYLKGPGWQSTVGKTACYKGDLASGR
jgi:hypothetical protein